MGCHRGKVWNHIQHRFRAITNLFSHLHIKEEEENDYIHGEIYLVVKMRVRELAKTALLPSDIDIAKTRKWVGFGVDMGNSQTHMGSHIGR
jgi:hypothetical protein